MTTTATDETAEAIKQKTRRLRVIATSLSRSDDLYAERTRLFRELRDLGVTQREIARIAGVGEVAVSKALRKE